MFGTVKTKVLERNNTDNVRTFYHIATKGLTIMIVLASGDISRLKSSHVLKNQTLSFRTFLVLISSHRKSCSSDQILSPKFFSKRSNL